VALALTLACGEEGITVDPGEFNPADVLTNLCISFDRSDVKTLTSLVGPAFVFYFDPDDVGQTPPGGSNYVIPESWSRTEFLAAAGNMLEHAYAVDLDIPTSGIGRPAAGAETYRAEAIPVSLLVMVDELNGFIANQGYCDFEFEKYHDNGEPRWRLTGWWDNTHMYCDAAAEPTSLGKILAIYH
jgi:hypothetical protein